MGTASTPRRLYPAGSSQYAGIDPVPRIRYRRVHGDRVDVSPADPTCPVPPLSVVDVGSLGIGVDTEYQVDGIGDRVASILDDARAYAETKSASAVEAPVEHDTSVDRAIRSDVDDHEVDLVVVGTRGRSGLGRLLLWSVAENSSVRPPFPF
jgi:nucleotide-binding universal stress UspA family protein